MDVNSIGGDGMLGLIAVLAFIAVQAVGIAVLGRITHGTFRAWWTS